MHCVCQPKNRHHHNNNNNNNNNNNINNNNNSSVIIVFVAPMLVGPSKCLKQIIQIKLTRVKNPNWPEANQLTSVYVTGQNQI